MKVLSDADKLALTGLLTLAGRHNSMIDELAATALEITGDSDAYGHTTDAIYEARSGGDHGAAVSEMLRKIKSREDRESASLSLDGEKQ